MAQGMHLPAAIPQLDGGWMRASNTPTGDPYSAAVSQQAGDYDEIMGNYRSLFGSASQNRPNPAQFSPISARTMGEVTGASYAPTADFTSLKGRLNENATTGGYSEQEISDLRARGISPIRAIYAAALRNLSRQKNISGGYSPNYGALQAKLARESSAAIGDQTIKANADIADRQASGRQAAISMLSPLVGNENQLNANIGLENTRAKQRVAEFNASELSNVDKINAQMAMEVERMNRENSNQTFNNQLNATQGMQSLYGTTPALTQTFGNQVLASNAQNLQGQQAISSAAQNRANTGLGLISRIPSSGFSAGRG